MKQILFCGMLVFCAGYLQASENEKNELDSHTERQDTSQPQSVRARVRFNLPAEVPKPVELTWFSAAAKKSQVPDTQKNDQEEAEKCSCCQEKKLCVVQ